VSPTQDNSLKGWDAIMRQVTHGYSWSGQERNVCYLNRGDGTFVNVSYISGFDHLDDSRALGLVDWDRDGDLDVWLRNRTAPRLRLLQNTQGNGQPWLRITLEGKTSNRDAIGAVVEITTKDGSPLVKSLRAGEFFMSQGSKALHFGLGQHRDIARVRVLWPGGAWQSFPRLSAHKHYHLQQGVSRPIEIPLPSAPTVATKTANAEPRARQSPIHLPVKIPIFPSFHYRDQALKLQALPPSKANRVILLWSSQCAACRKELPALLKRYANNTTELLALCVDPIDDSADAYALMDELGWPFPWGFAERATLERLEHWQQILFDRAPTLSVPFSILLDSDHNVLALQRGPGDLTNTLPFTGRWFTNPVSPAYVYEDFGRLFGERFPAEGLYYLELAAQHAQTNKLHPELASKHQQLARQHAEANRPQQAIHHFDKALSFSPESASLCHNYGIFLAQHGQLPRAYQLLKRALQFAPDSEATKTALEMVEADLTTRTP
jgi:tetratricopeptide (TPR) repeat protein